MAAATFVVGQLRYRGFAAALTQQRRAGGGGQPLVLAGAVVVLGLVGAVLVAELHTPPPR